MNASNKTLVAAVLAALALGPALAGNDKHGKGNHKGERHARAHSEVRVQQRVVIADGPHVVRSCPPGLAKKNNGCVPPGQAKKANRVIVGQPVPAGAVYVIPRPVLRTLPPPPVGYRYAVVNNQVVLVSDTNNLVVEIIRSLLG